MSKRSGLFQGRRLALTLVVVLAAASALVVSAVLLVDDGDDRGAAGPTPLTTSTTPVAASVPTSSTPASAAVQYYADTRVALSPLIVHVRDIPQALSALAIPGSQTFTALASVGESWESDVATARDLVTRLPATSTPSGLTVKSLYQSGSMLYVESARAISVAAAQTSAERVVTAQRGLRYLQIADRTFDSAYRLLNAGSELSNSEMIFPVTVPDFTSVKRKDVYDLQPAVATVGVWARDHKAVLLAARSAVAASPRPATSTPSALRRDIKNLGSPVPADPLSREGVITVRLGALVVAESLTLPNGLEADRLSQIGRQLWTTGAVLLARTGETRAAGVGLGLPAPPEFPRDLLFSGGAFNGTPPPLQPGDGPGAGVPGGLPMLDPLAILGGR